MLTVDILLLLLFLVCLFVVLFVCSIDVVAIVVCLFVVLFPDS